jgi:peptide/nickel transport system permease protein
MTQANQSNQRLPDQSSHRRRTREGNIAVLVRLLTNVKGAVGTLIIATLIIAALLGPHITPYKADAIHLSDQFARPSAKYWFGADELGRDIFSRVVDASPLALETGVFAVLISAFVGVSTGLAAGYLGGWSDLLFMRLWDTVLAFPAIFLAIGIVTIIGPGHLNAVLAVAIINMPAFAILVRATTLSIKNKEFVEATRAMGASRAHIMIQTILPNCIAPILVQMAVTAPAAILIEATLSYLGLGAQLPAPSWGNMLSSAQGYLYRAPTYGIFPGLAITIVVIGMNYFADGLQDAIDPRRVRAAAKRA